MRRNRGSRFLATVLALALTLVGVALASHQASAYTVRKTASVTWNGPSGAGYGDPDMPGGSGVGSGSLPGGITIIPHTSMQPTGSRTRGEGAVVSKQDWMDAVRMLWAQWRVIFVR